LSKAIARRRPAGAGASVASITWPQVLAWRMRRQLLDPVGSLAVPQVVARLCGVQAQVASAAELAVGLRRVCAHRGEVLDALAQGRLIKTWAMRGALHLLTPQDAGGFLSLISAQRVWERPSWQRDFGMTPKHWETLRAAAREALDGATLTRDELAAAIGRKRSLRHLRDALRSGWGTLLKPLAWQGELCFGPRQGSRVTFMRPEAVSSCWAGLPEPEEAATDVVAAYLRAHGPSTGEAFAHWVSGGWFGKRQLRAWFAASAEHLAAVDVEGECRYVLAEDVEELVATAPTNATRLLPAFDQFVLGPGTGDANVVPPSRRGAVSKQSGWIAPLVLTHGVVAGTWKIDGRNVDVAWFREAGRPSRSALGDEVVRLSSFLERTLDLAVAVV
jgi:hypothetical protein